MRKSKCELCSVPLHEHEKGRCDLCIESLAQYHQLILAKSLTVKTRNHLRLLKLKPLKKVGL